MRHFHIKIFIFITCIFLVNSCNKPDQISKGESRVGSLKVSATLDPFCQREIYKLIKGKDYLFQFQGRRGV